jgi:hypothetical protein
MFNKLLAIILARSILHKVRRLTPSLLDFDVMCSNQILGTLRQPLDMIFEHEARELQAIPPLTSTRNIPIEVRSVCLCPPPEFHMVIEL